MMDIVHCCNKIGKITDIILVISGHFFQTVPDINFQNKKFEKRI